jgi:hypothetical protein
MRCTDLLAQEFRGPADHQPGYEDGQQREHEHGVEPAAVATRADLGEQNAGERSGAPDRGVAVKGRIGGTGPRQFYAGSKRSRGDRFVSNGSCGSSRVTVLEATARMAVAGW